MNKGGITGPVKQIEFICMDCKKRIDTETLHMAPQEGIAIASSWLMLMLVSSLASKLKGPVKVNAICNECANEESFILI